MVLPIPEEHLDSIIPAAFGPVKGFGLASVELLPPPYGEQVTCDRWSLLGPLLKLQADGNQL